jgi:hypothetical protein
MLAIQGVNYRLQWQSRGKWRILQGLLVAWIPVGLGHKVESLEEENTRLSSGNTAFPVYTPSVLAVYP